MEEAKRRTILIIEDEEAIAELERIRQEGQRTVDEEQVRLFGGGA